MKRHFFSIFVISAILIVLAASLAAAHSASNTRKDYDGRLGSIMQGDVVGDELELHYNVRSRGLEDIEGAKVSIWVPELELFWRTSSFKLRSGDTQGKFLTFPFDGAEPGDYFARVMFSSDHSKDIRWMWITIE